MNYKEHLKEQRIIFVELVEEQRIIFGELERAKAKLTELERVINEMRNQSKMTEETTISFADVWKADRAVINHSKAN